MRNKVLSLLLSVGLISSFTTTPALADTNAKQELLGYLKNYASFTANFSLVAKDPKGRILNTQSGVIRGQKPMNLYLHTQKPVENFLAVYKGEVTYYDPFVEQVTISPLESSKPLPFTYLLNDNAKAWANAKVTKKGNCYKVDHANLRNTYKFLQACVTDGTLTEFSYIEKNGNQATYTFSNFTATSLGPDSFKVSYPANTHVERK